MRNKVRISIAFSLLLFTKCDDVDKLLTFPIYHQVEFQIESNSLLNAPFEIATPDVTTNSSQTFENNNTAASHVKDIRLEKLDLTVTSPSGKTFSFLKSIKLYISTDQGNEIELASQENIPATATTISLIPTKEKLDTYVKSSAYKLRTSVITRETLTQDVDVRSDLRFKVTAAPL